MLYKFPRAQTAQKSSAPPHANRSFYIYTTTTTTILVLDLTAPCPVLRYVSSSCPADRADDGTRRSDHAVLVHVFVRIRGRELGMEFRCSCGGSITCSGEKGGWG